MTVSLPINLVSPDEDQPRKLFDDAAIAELWSSIRENGLQQPIKVRRDPEREGAFVIVFGERRYRAHVYGGAATIDAVVDEAMNDRASVDVAQIIENDQRESVTPLERARSYEGTGGALISVEPIGLDDLDIMAGEMMPEPIAIAA